MVNERAKMDEGDKKKFIKVVYRVTNISMSNVKSTFVHIIIL
jgi:hypothetical protein